MTKQTKPSEFDKFKRYRENRKAQGLKLVRMWLPDTRTPSFRRKARRQAALLRSAPEESDALAFIEAAADHPDWTA